MKTDNGYRMKKVLITGGCGFLGSHLADFLSKNHEIDIVDDESTGSVENIKHLLVNTKKVRFHRIDLLEWLRKKPDMDQYDYVYHLAAMVGVKRVLENPLRTIEVNVHGTEMLLDLIAASKTKPKLFIASTSEVYGKNGKWALSEDDDRIVGSTMRSRWVYADSKALDEFMAAQYSKKYDMRIAVGRLFSIVGPRQSPMYGMVLPKFVEQALVGKPITVYGDGTQIRSFMHVRDCVSSIFSMMMLDRDFILCNIGNPEPVMIRDLAWRVRHWVMEREKVTIDFQNKFEIEYIPYDKAYNDLGYEDMMRRVPDVTKLMKDVFGGMPRGFADLDMTINDTIDWSMKQK